MLRAGAQSFFFQGLYSLTSVRSTAVTRSWAPSLPEMPPVCPVFCVLVHSACSHTVWPRPRGRCPQAGPFSLFSGQESTGVTCTSPLGPAPTSGQGRVWTRACTPALSGSSHPHLEGQGQDAPRRRHVPCQPLGLGAHEPQHLRFGAVGHGPLQQRLQGLPARQRPGHQQSTRALAAVACALQRQLLLQSSTP